MLSKKANLFSGSSGLPARRRPPPSAHPTSSSGHTVVIIVVVVILVIGGLVAFFVLKKHKEKPTFVPPPQVQTVITGAEPAEADGPADGGPGHSPAPLAGTQLPFEIPSGTYSGSTSVKVAWIFTVHLHVSAAIREFDVKTLQATTDIHITGVANITANGTIMTIAREPGPNGRHKVTPSGSAWSSQIAPKLSDSSVEWDPNSNAIYLSGKVVGNTASFTLTN